MRRIVTSLGLVALTACSLLAPLHVQQDSADAATEPRDVAPATCPLAVPAAPPAASDPSNDEERSFVVAVRTLDLQGDADGGTAPRYDLDGVSTCCQGAGPSCTSSTPHCDADGGVDNAFATLIADLGAVSPSFSETTINELLAAGAFSFLLQIQHYNGTPNDTSLTVGAFVSRGLDGEDGGVPRWEGSDEWTVDTTYVLGSPESRPVVPGRFDAHAYVTDGVLVASFDYDLLIGSASGNGVLVSTTGGRIVARVVANADGSFSLVDGVLSGRWSTHALLAEIPSIYTLGAFLCATTSTYQQLKPLLCATADIRTTRALDDGSGACDALSIEVGFRAEPARIGRPVAPQPRPNNCPDASADDCSLP